MSLDQNYWAKIPTGEYVWAKITWTNILRRKWLDEKYKHVQLQANMKPVFFFVWYSTGLYKLGDPPISAVRFSLPRLNRVHCFARARCKVWSKENEFKIIIII